MHPLTALAAGFGHAHGHTLSKVGLTEDMSALSGGDLLAVAAESGLQGDWQTPMKRGCAMGIDAARRLAERVYRDRREAAAGSESEQ